MIDRAGCKGSLNAYFSSMLGKASVYAMIISLQYIYPFLLKRMGIPAMIADSVCVHTREELQSWLKRVQDIDSVLTISETAKICLLIIGFENSIASLIVLFLDDVNFFEARQLLRSYMPDDLKQIVETCCPQAVKILNNQM